MTELLFVRIFCVIVATRLARWSTGYPSTAVLPAQAGNDCGWT